MDFDNGNMDICARKYSFAKICLHGIFVQERILFVRTSSISLALIKNLLYAKLKYPEMFSHLIGVLGQRHRCAGRSRKMSITVSDVMRLPSMVGAEVVAGVQGLNNPVESVTVLEYGYTSNLLDQLFEKIHLKVMNWLLLLSQRFLTMLKHNAPISENTTLLVPLEWFFFMLGLSFPTLTKNFWIVVMSWVSRWFLCLAANIDVCTVKSLTRFFLEFFKHSKENTFLLVPYWTASFRWADCSSDVHAVWYANRLCHLGRKQGRDMTKVDCCSWSRVTAIWLSGHSGEIVQKMPSIIRWRAAFHVRFRWSA